MPSSHPDLTPASVLLALRETPGLTQDALCRHFGIGTRYDLRHSQLGTILLGLAAVDLVEPVEGAGSTPPGNASERRYQVSPYLEKVQAALGLSLRSLAESSASLHRAECHELGAIISTLEQRLPDLGYTQDLIQSLRELCTCLRSRCYIATMALSGKILEIVIKQHLEGTGAQVQPDLMLGQMLKRLGEQGEYVDPGMQNVANLINCSRIPAVHAKREVPVPTADQAVLVTRAVLDMVKRLLLATLPA